MVNLGINAKNFQERLNDSIRQHADVIQGHDAVHPDRNDCGGVGGCGLMRAEHELENEIAMMLRSAAGKFRLGISVETRRG